MNHDLIIGLRCLMCEDFVQRPIDAEDFEAWLKSSEIQAYLVIHHYVNGGHSQVVELYSGIPRTVYDY